MELNELIGEIINKIDIGENDEYAFVRFHTNSKIITYSLDGDCCLDCTFSYISKFEDKELIVGKKILSINYEYFDFIHYTENSNFKYTKYYFYDLISENVISRIYFLTNVYYTTYNGYFSLKEIVCL